MPKGPQGQKRPAVVIGKVVKVMPIATREKTETATAEEGRNQAAEALGLSIWPAEIGTPEDAASRSCQNCPGPRRRRRVRNRIAAVQSAGWILAPRRRHSDCPHRPLLQRWSVRSVDVVWAGLSRLCPARRSLRRQELKGAKPADLPVEQPTNSIRSSISRRQKRSTPTMRQTLVLGADE
jgi:hypothetical protein